MTQAYRPSNGTEGEIFMARWCATCQLDKAHREDWSLDGCEIIAQVMALPITHADYPPQWVIGQHGPRCTAYCSEDDPENPGPLDPAAVIRPLL